ncbi:MAG: hypothetical protein R3313_03235 [Candidatus Saccharimonadales bacterium]|nr:hypothetical protein [Candidatus Saccharimonadales bacterium]
MKRSPEGAPKRSPESIAKWLRNVNAIGAVALGGAGIVLESAALMALGAINAAQAGFFEATRRVAAKRGGKKLKPA